jgi:hypothetical protein
MLLLSLVVVAAVRTTDSQLSTAVCAGYSVRPHSLCVPYTCVRTVAVLTTTLHTVAVVVDI